MFKELYLDISSSCNAQCAYCQTGVIDLDKRTFKYSDITEIEKAFDNLINKGLISKEETYFCLYNWGEPTLHPQFKEILRFFKKYTASRLVLSSNFSKRIIFNPKEDDLSHLMSFVISMPGFSQYSYDKIHKFNFETIKNNITETVKNMRDCGFKGAFHISFHLYHFNLHEYKDALDFAIENSMTIEPVFAIINDFNRHQKLLSGKLSNEETSTILKDIVYDTRWDKISPLEPNAFCSMYKNYIVMDTDLNIITCCGDSSIYKKAYDVSSMNEIFEWQMGSEGCRKCKASGMCSLSNMVIDSKKNPAKDLFMSVGERIINRITLCKQYAKYCSAFFEKSNYERIAIYGCGTMGKFLYSELKNSKTKIVCFIDNYSYQTDFDGVKVIKSEEIKNVPIDAIVLTNQPYDYLKANDAINKYTKLPVIKLTDVMYFIEKD